MKKFKVRVTYIYADTVEVFAESEDEAKEKAIEQAEEVFDCLYDTEILATTSV